MKTIHPFPLVLAPGHSSPTVGSQQMCIKWKKDWMEMHILTFDSEIPPMTVALYPLPGYRSLWEHEKSYPQKNPLPENRSLINKIYPTIAFHFRRWRITALCKYNHSVCHLMSPLELPSPSSFQSNIRGHCGNASCPYSISISKLTHCTGNGKEQENVARTRQEYVHADREGKDLPSQPTNPLALSELRLASTRNHFP